MTTRDSVFFFFPEWNEAPVIDPKGYTLLRPSLSFQSFFFLGILLDACCSSSLLFPFIPPFTHSKRFYTFFPVFAEDHGIILLCPFHIRSWIVLSSSPPYSLRYNLRFLRNTSITSRFFPPSIGPLSPLRAPVLWLRVLRSPSHLPFLSISPSTPRYELSLLFY